MAQAQQHKTLHIYEHSHPLLLCVLLVYLLAAATHPQTTPLPLPLYLYSAFQLPAHARGIVPPSDLHDCPPPCKVQRPIAALPPLCLPSKHVTHDGGGASDSPAPYLDWILCLLLIVVCIPLTTPACFDL